MLSTHLEAILNADDRLAERALLWPRVWGDQVRRRATDLGSTQQLDNIAFLIRVMLTRDSCR